MSNRKRIFMIWALAIGALVGLVYLQLQLGSFKAVDVKLVATPVEGEVLAIETLSDPSRKEAVVKLTSGETVRASVPPACVVFPGQKATLSRMQAEGIIGSFYMLKGSKDKNDS